MTISTARDGLVPSLYDSALGCRGLRESCSQRPALPSCLRTESTRTLGPFMPASCATARTTPSLAFSRIIDPPASARGLCESFTFRSLQRTLSLALCGPNAHQAVVTSKREGKLPFLCVLSDDVGDGLGHFGHGARVLHYADVGIIGQAGVEVFELLVPVKVHIPTEPLELIDKASLYEGVGAGVYACAALSDVREGGEMSEDGKRGKRSPVKRQETKLT